MPVVLVYGVPEETGVELETMIEELRGAVDLVPELGLNMDKVSAFFPQDMMPEGLGEEIIIFVEGLFSKPERTEKVRNRYAQALGEIAKRYFPKALVEVFVRSFDPAQGFWTSDNK